MNSEKKLIDDDMLEALLYLSRLAPSSVDLKTLKNQTEQIVAYLDILSRFDDSENPYDAYPSTDADSLREDEIEKGLDIPDLKKMTGEFMDGYFRVPKVLGEGA
ncbi:MAG: Asp-tRNA(Asn)/Glu-tRNA(Gln) amidotransferase subunit GatC [Treponema sp.]|uniref:Asp-tRNA(Asn)/Glu-tRNA(Gln) amidotransferase subunit GatC n=1 Tax=Treponema sp. TaxID=166 RepID=UPI003FA1FC33